MPANNQLHQDQWLDITDFSAGCYSHDNTPSPTQVDRLLPAPPGAADAAGTYGCLCLPQGGLGALPALVDAYTWTATDNGAGTNYLVGLLIHDELGDGNTEAFVINEFDDGVNRYYDAYSYIVETTTFTAIQTNTESTASGLFGAPYPVFTRANLIFVATVSLSTTTSITGTFPASIVPGMFAFILFGTGTIPPDTTVISNSGSTIVLSNATTAGTADVGFSSTTMPGSPVIVFPTAGPASPTDPASGQLYMYPNPATPTSYTPLPMIYDLGGGNWSSITGQTIAHQSRIIILAGQNEPYPAGGGFSDNEQINYTDPPLSPALGNQKTILVAEEPYGYGAWGSINAGELFLVKKRGGGVVLTGDIFSPNVTYLPGVQPTGGFVGQANSGMAGFFYCSYANGAWLWNGGNTAQKISTQLDDLFYLPPEWTTIQSNNYGYYTQSIGDKTYFSNNWLYDQRAHSWWKYYPDEAQGGTSMFWVQPVAGQYIYTAALSFTSSGNFLYRFDTSKSTQGYQWRSLPLRLVAGDELQDRVTDVREVVVRASCAVPSAAAVTLTLLDAGSVVWGPVAQTGNVSAGPDIIRWNLGSAAGAGGLRQPQIQLGVISSTNDDNAVIHSISVKYRNRAHEATTN